MTARRGRTCVEFAAELAAPEMAAPVAAHLAACAACRATAAALTSVRPSTADEGPDLWPRLRARLEADARPACVLVTFPDFGWGAVAALVTLVAATSLAPDPGRLLAVLLGMV